MTLTDRGLFAGPRRALWGIPDLVGSLPTPGGAVVVVTGPAGSGKSTVAREIAAALPGWTTVRVRALPWERDDDGRLLDGVRDDLGHGADLGRRIDTKDGSTLLIVDDAHWADAASLRDLTSLVLRMRRGRCALVLTCAAEVTPDPVSALAEIRAVADLTVTVPPLSTDDIRAVLQNEVGVQLGATTLRRVADCTDGRPGRLRELVSAVPADHWAAVDPVVPVPDLWQARTLQKLRDLDEGARTAVTVTAVLGREAPLPVVRQVCGGYTGPEHALAAVSAAVTAGVLRVVASGSREYVDLVDGADRHVVAGQVSPEVGADIHRRAAQVFEERGDGEESLLHLTLARSATGDVDTREVATYAEDLGYQGLWRASSRMYRLASAVEPDQGTAARLQLAAVEALLAAADIPEAVAQAGSLDRGRRSPQQDSMLGYLAIHEGRRSEAVGLLSRASDALMSGGRAVADGDIARLAARQILLCLVEWNIPSLVRWAELSERRSPYTSGDRIESAAIAMVGRSALSGRPRLDVAAAGEDLAQTESRDVAVGWVSLIFDDPLTAYQRLSARSHLDVTERTILWKDAWLARATLVLGKIEEARLAAEQGLERAHRLGIAFLEPLLLWTAAEAADLQGRADLCRHYLSQLGIGSDAFMIQRIPSEMARQVIAYGNGDLAGAERAGRALCGLREETNIAQPGFWLWEDVHTQVLVRLGRVAEADEFLAEAEERAAESGIDSVRARLLVPRGNILIQQGRTDEGLDALAEASDTVARLGMPFHEGRIDFEYGQLLRRLGRRRDADTLFGKAQSIFSAMGATRMVDLTARERRAGGVGARQGSAGDLSPQEQQIAKLVAAGATNREVSAELFVSPKTVEYHLTRIFRKLSIARRSELADVLGGE
jgi:LuxR family maltose regulon positive regulatory protein